MPALQGTMFSAFARALGQFNDPAFRRPLAWSVVLSIVIFAGLLACVYLVLAHTAFFETFWLNAVIDTLGGLAALVLTVLLFPGIVAAILSLFLERIVAAVEVRHYPNLPPPRQAPWPEQIGGALKFLAVVIIANLIALPLYLIPFVNLVVFALLNGYLLSREYYGTVAPRRLSVDGQGRLWRQRRATFILAGIVLALASSVPLVSFVVPVVAAAVMTHLVEAHRASVAGGSLATVAI
jgi:CysZ protein